VAGTGVPGYNCDQCPVTESQINTPNGLALDSTGRFLFIAGEASNRIRKVDLVLNIITTIAGTGQPGFSGDNGTATSAQLHNPRDVIVDPNGNVYIADYTNNRVRRVDTSGIITTYAGNGKSTGPLGDDGPALLARVDGPTGLVLDPGGNLYISDAQDHLVRQVSAATSDHIITTVAGNGNSGYNGDGGPATEASLGSPRGITLDLIGRLYIAQFSVGVIRVVFRGGTPTQVEAVSGTPQSAQIGTAFPQALQVVVRDANSSVVTGATVTFTAPGSGASATLSTTTATSDINGFASTNATANTTTGTYNVTAVSGTSTQASFNLTNLPGTVVSGGITFEQQPSNTTAGAVISPAVTVRVRDTNNNPVSGAAVTLNTQTSGTALNGTLTQTTNASGIATFGDLSINRTGTYNLQATGPNNLGAISSAFNILPSAPFVITVSGGDTQSSVVGTGFPSALKVAVKDSLNNPVENAPVTFTAVTALSGASATFNGNSTATVNTDALGFATSPPLTSNTKTGAFEVTATTSNASQATFHLTNTPGPATIVTFLQQPPGTTTAGSPITVKVQLTDQFNNPVLAGQIVTVQLTGGSQVISPTPTQTTDASGAATFTGLVVTATGTYQLLGADTGSAVGLSNSFTITAAAPASIQPTSVIQQSTQVSTPFPSPLSVVVRDQYNNPVTNVAVTFAPSGAAASATVAPSQPATNSNGEASTIATANATAGGPYPVTATAAGLATPATFALTNTPQPPDLISFSMSPIGTIAAGSPFTAQVLLTNSGLTPISNATVTLQVLNGPPSGSLLGNLSAITDGSGHATFSGLMIQTAGSYQLYAASVSVSALSAAFQITPGSAASIAPLSGTPQSSVVSTVFSVPLQVIVKDSFQNPVSGNAVTFAVVGGGAGTPGATFASPLAVTTNANGVAMASSLTSNQVAGMFQVTATAAGVGTPATFALTNVPGAPNLKFGQQPTSVTAGATIPNFTVQLVDQFGNSVSTAGVAVTLGLVPAGIPVDGVLTQITAANGIATFSGLKISTAGTYQFTATSPDIESATSNTFNINPGPPAQIITKGGTPQTTTVSTSFPANLKSQVLDAVGNPVANVTVVFAAPASGASATLDGSNTFSTQTDDLGRASSPVPLANGVAGGYSITATVSGLPAVSFNLTNAAGLPSTLSFVQSPANTPAGATIGPVVVKLVDSGNNPISGAVVTMAAQDGPGSLDGTITQTTDATGQATYNNLKITKTGTYTLEAATDGISKSSSPFAITAAQAVTITTFDGNGQSAAVGTAHATPLKASVNDAFGNNVPGVEVTFSVVPGGAGATFNGPATVITDANGLATSPTLTASQQIGQVQVNATVSGAGTPAVFTLANVAGAASHLTFTVQPTNTLAHATITPAPAVQLRDSSGNPVFTPGVPVTLQLVPLSQRFQALSGTVTQNTDGNGTATFANLTIDQVGAYDLRAESDGIASAASNDFVISPNTATGIQALAGTPQSATILTAFSVPLQAKVADGAGNPVSGVLVTFTAPVTGASGTFGGLASAAVSTDSQGIASATLTANGTPGSYSVAATASSVTGTAIFAMTNLAPASAALAFVQQPSNTPAGQLMAPSVTVQVQDSQGRPIGLSGIAVVLSIASGTGTFGGTPVQSTNSNGLATFPDLTFSQAGTKTLRATALAQAPATSASFQITAGSASGISVLAGSPQAATALQPFSTPLQAQVRDISGNPVGGVTVTFSAPASDPTGTFSGPATVTTDGNGVATAPTLTANNTPGTFAVTATAAGVAAPATFTLAVLPASSGTLELDEPRLIFASEINQPAPAPEIVRISTTNGAVASWTVTSSAPWLTASPTSGNTPASISVSVNPAGLAVGSYGGILTFASPTAGQTSLLVAYTITAKPSLVVTPPALIFASLVTVSRSLTAPTPETLNVIATDRGIAYTVSTQVTSPAGGQWLNVSPAQGQTPGTVQVSVSTAGLTEGIYAGTVTFTASESGISPVVVPVRLVVCSQNGCAGVGQPEAPAILSVVNAASFHPNGSPGAISTVFGVNLSDAVYQAQTYPLPTQLGPTSVTVNGVAAPLFYASPTQINFQIPANTTPGVPNVGVNTGLLRAGSGGFPAAVAAVDPGIFLNGGRAAALNPDLSVNTAATPQPAGAILAIFITGVGQVAPAVPDGTAAPVSPLSFAVGTVTAAIGGKPAQVTFAGLAPGFAGLAQINVQIPAGLSPGDQPVFVSVNGVPSNAGLVTVR
jgi:adhesin/invasin